MWEIIKIILYYSFAIAIGLVMVAVIIFSLFALIFFFIELFKNRPTTLKGCASSILKGCLATAGFFIILLVALTISVYVLGLSEDEDYEYRLDQQYEEMSDTGLTSEDNVLVIAKKTGRIGGGKNSTPPSIDFYMKNYNTADFKGSITIHIMLDGESIDRKEVEIDLSVEGFSSRVLFPSDFDIDDRSWKDIWKKVEIDYTLDGEFKN